MPRGLAGHVLSLYREQGDCPDMVFGRILPDRQSIEWIPFPHEQADGIGALKQILTQHGYTLGPIPKGRRPHGPAWWIVLRALFTKLPVRGPRVPWKDFDPTVPVPSPRPAWTILTREQTAALDHAARQRHVSLNSLLLHVLNETVSFLLSDRSRPRIWMVPVNLRGVVGSPGGDDDETANHVSIIGCRIEPDATPRDVHRTIKDQLRRNVHLAAWWKMRAASLLGPAFLRHAMRRARREPRYWTGLFSNVGEWSPSGGEEGVAWCAGPPASFEMAIGAVVMTWRGQLTMTFTVHPGIPDSDVKARKVINDWREALLATIETPVNEDGTAAAEVNDAVTRTGAGSAPYASPKIS